MKKVISVLTALAVLMTAALTVSAGNQEIVSANCQSAETVLYSVDGKSAPASLRRELEALNITVADDSLIEIVPMQTTDSRAVKSSNASGQNATALTITNRSGDTIMKDILFCLVGEEVASIQPVAESARNMSSGAGVWLPSEDTQILRAVCAYNEVYVPDDSWETNPYYQPISMYFIYYDNGVDLVRNVTVEYQCVGFEYSYPGFIDLGTHELEPYEHVIIAEVAAPVSNTLYSGIGGAYPTNKCIFTRGTPVGTHCFAFEMEINNGNPVSGGVPIF